MALFGSGTRKHAKDIGGAILNQAGIMLLGRDFAGERERDARRRGYEEEARRAFGDDATAMLLLRTNPKAFAEELAKRYAPMEVTAGNSVLNGPNGSLPWLAPKVERFDDRFGAYGSDGTVTYSAPRGPTFVEESEHKKRLADIQDAVRRTEIIRGELGVRQRHLALAEKEFDERKRSGDFGGTSVTREVGDALRRRRLGQPPLPGDDMILNDYFSSGADPIKALIADEMGRAGLGGGAVSAPPPISAPRDPRQRRAGAVYQTPQGPMRWTGTGWLPAR